MFIRAIAIMAPGMFLSQPPTATTPSMLCAPQAVSMESAMTSRDTSEYFIPSVPIEMPSLTVMVPKICGMPPAWLHCRFGPAREHVEAGVARRDGAVRVGDADDGLAEVVVAETDRAEHGPVGRALHALGDGAASEFVGHEGMYGESGRAVGGRR